MGSGIIIFSPGPSGHAVRDRSTARCRRDDPGIATGFTVVGLLARRRAIDFARKESRRPQPGPLPDAESLTRAAIESTAALHCEG